MSAAQRAPVDLDSLGISPIQWCELWAEQVDSAEWCIEPILPRGRQAGLFAVAGTGKSLLAADIAAAKATGTSVLGQTPQEPVDVVYLDLEMTPDDLRDRLTDMGYGPHSDLSRLHYYQLPSLPPLDTVDGGDVLMAIVMKHTAELVVIDTMARVVEGDENSADTYRDFFRCTGARLKGAGISLLRLDHAGKDLTKGQRGSSSKNDDLDVVWSLKVLDDQVVLVRTKSRVSYTAPEVVLIRRVDPRLRHELTPVAWLAGTAEVVELLDDLDVAIDATCATAQTALTKNGTGRRKAVVLAAIKYRKQRENSGTAAGTAHFERREPHSGTASAAYLYSQVSGSGTVAGTVGTVRISHREPVSLCNREPFPDHETTDPETTMDIDDVAHFFGVDEKSEV